MWFRWVTDLGLPGPDRGEGGRYLLVGPGYDGALPDSGFHVSHVGTTRAAMIGRAFVISATSPNRQRGRFFRFLLVHARARNYFDAAPTHPTMKWRQSSPDTQRSVSFPR
jgi:hypothetical protein